MLHRLYWERGGRKKKKIYKLPQILPWRGLGGSDLDNEPGKHIIRVMDMRVALDDIRVAALVADGVEGLALSDHINLVAGPLREMVPSHRFICDGVLPYGGQQDQPQQHNRTIPWRHISDGFRRLHGRGGRRRSHMYESSWKKMGLKLSVPLHVYKYILQRERERERVGERVGQVNAVCVGRKLGSRRSWTWLYV